MFSLPSADEMRKSEGAAGGSERTSTETEHAISTERTKESDRAPALRNVFINTCIFN